MQVWQGPALDALAAWLAEDPGRIEPRLRQQDAVQRFVALFASYSQNADSEALARLLDPFLRIMKRSRKITVTMLFTQLIQLCSLMYSCLTVLFEEPCKDSRMPSSMDSFLHYVMPRLCHNTLLDQLELHGGQLTLFASCR